MDTSLKQYSAEEPYIDNLDVMELLRRNLATYVHEDLKGFLSIAADPAHILELLGEAPGRFRVILSWMGETPAGTHKVTGIMTHEIKVIVSQNRGLALRRGENVFVKRAEDRPLLEYFNLVRDFVRGLVFPLRATERTMEYAGAEPVIVENTLLDAFQMTFRFRAALRQPEARDATAPA